MSIKDRPLTSLLTEVVSELAYLLQTEIRLAKTELSEKASQAAQGGTMIGVGAVLALAGLIIFLHAVVSWLAVAGLPQEWGYLLVGVAVLAIGGVLAMRGVNNLKGSALTPDKTVKQVRADFSVMKEQVK